MLREVAVRSALWIVIALTVSGRADGALAAGAAVRTVGPDAIPASLQSYDTKSAVLRPAGADRTCFKTAPFQPSFRQESSSGNSSSRSRYLPVVLSLLVPGAGEIYMGHYVRGGVLIAAEITAWTGYAYYHDKGLDSRVAYERFADEHWNYDKWINDHALWWDPVYQDSAKTFDNLYRFGPDWDGWPPYHSWHSKEEEKQNYYENIGKYDWFISGWEDWHPGSVMPRESALRTTYRAMRKESNDQLDRATSFIYLSVAARVASLVETLILTRRGGESEAASSEGASKGFSFHTRATGIDSGEIELVYHFR